MVLHTARVSMPRWQERVVWWRSVGGCVMSRDDLLPNLQLVVTCLLVIVVTLVLDSGAVNATGFQELGESLERPLSVVIDDLVVALLEQLDGGEALDLDVFQLVGGGVHLGDDDALMVLVFLSQFVPDWSKLLAMTTPWSIEFN